MAKRSATVTGGGLADLLQAVAPGTPPPDGAKKKRSKNPELPGVTRILTADEALEVEARASYDEDAGCFKTLPSGAPLVSQVKIFPGPKAPLTSSGSRYQGFYVPLGLAPLVLKPELLGAVVESAAALTANWARIGNAKAKVGVPKTAK